MRKQKFILFWSTTFAYQRTLNILFVTHCYVYSIVSGKFSRGTVASVIDELNAEWK